MSSPTDSGFLGEWGATIIGGLAAVASAIGGFLFHRVVEKHDEEMKALKADIAKVEVDVKAVGEQVDRKVDFAVWERNRVEARENIIAVHEKVENSARELHERIDLLDRTATDRHLELLGELRK